METFLWMKTKPKRLSTSVNKMSKPDKIHTILYLVEDGQHSLPTVKKDFAKLINNYKEENTWRKHKTNHVRDGVCVYVIQNFLDLYNSLVSLFIFNMTVIFYVTSLRYEVSYLSQCFTKNNRLSCLNDLENTKLWCKVHWWFACM